MTNAKTSVTHPLEINFVMPPDTAGKVGMTLCPGRKASSASGGSWDRDLNADLDRIRLWNPDLVVTLLEDSELAKLGVPDFRRQVLASGLPWAFMPIRDGAAPDQQFTTAWESIGPRLRNLLRRGGRVLIHCRAGLGRTGTIAAAILVEFGVPPEHALAKVRLARGPHAVEPLQEIFVRACQPLTQRCSRSYRIAGSFFGGAVGDALGAPFKNLTASQIEQHLGEPFVWKYHTPITGSLLELRRRGAGWPTHNTAMALSVADVIFQDKNSGAEQFARAFSNDMDLKGGRFGTFFWDSLPGFMSFEALQGDGNGAAARAYPIGFMSDRYRSLIAAETQAKLTHSHPAAISAAKAVVAVVHDALSGLEPTLDPPDGIDDPTFIAAWHEAHHAIKRGAQRLPRHLQSSDTRGWTTVATACAIAYCFQDEPKKAIAAAAASGRDTATVASIVGAIVGARGGLDVLDFKLIDKLKVADHIGTALNSLQLPDLDLLVFEKPPKLSTDERYIYRVYRMLAELHRRGYEQLRIVPGISSSGCHYRSSVTYAGNSYADHGALAVDFSLVAHNTSGNFAELFMWRDAPGAKIATLADFFIERFPEISERGKAKDEAYVLWFREIVYFARAGAFPVVYSDSIYHTDGEAAPLQIKSTDYEVALPFPPPGLNRKYFFKRNVPSDEFGIPFDTIESAIISAKRRSDAAFDLEEKTRLYLLNVVYNWAASQGLRISDPKIAEAEYMNAYALENLYFSFPDSESEDDLQQRHADWKLGLSA